jgi:hypothetical protein
MFICIGFKEKNEMKSKENEDSQPPDPMQQLSKKLDQLVVTLYEVFNVMFLSYNTYFVYLAENYFSKLITIDNSPNH